MRPSLALFLAAALSGCAHNQDVRYVYQDSDFGVVGMPENTNCWPTHYRRRGEKLMAAHFPEGHEIVRAEEVIEGEAHSRSRGRIPPKSPRKSASLCSGSSSWTFGQPQRGRDREGQGVPHHLQAFRLCETQGLCPSRNVDPDLVC